MHCPIRDAHSPAPDSAIREPGIEVLSAASEPIPAVTRVLAFRANEVLADVRG
jgi:hypothetical protein